MGKFKSFDDFQRTIHKGLDRQENHKETNFISNVNNDSTELPLELSNKNIKKKRRKIRIKKKWKTRFMMGCAVFFIILLSFLFLPLPFGDIRVTGSAVVTRSDIIFEGKIKYPVNVLQINISNVKQRLLHDIRVSSIDIKRSFPFYIDVIVHDRTPYAIVQGDYVYAVLDKNGRVMDTQTSISGLDLPIITGKKLGNLLLEDIVQEESINKALQFISSLSQDGFKQFSEVNIGQPNNIIAYTRDGIAVHLGSGEHIDKQAVMAENMVGDIMARGLSVEYIEVNLTSPFIKLKK